MEFPRHHVWVYKDCVPEETVRNIRELAPAYAQAPNYWMPKEALEEDLRGSALTAAEAAIWFLYHAVAKHRLPEDVAGAEWWVQVYEGGRGLAFHFDKDEDFYKTSNVMKHPYLSSVLYLTGMDEDRLRQACTVILDQRFDSEQAKTDPEAPASCVFVPPSTGKYCLFDGKLGHGVLDSSNPARRATMLINWWKERPKAVHRPSGEELIQLRGTHASAPLTPFPLPTPLATEGVPCASQQQYPVIRIPSEDEDIKECGILVDDLFDAYLLDSFGANAVQAVAVWYEGHMLYPIDPAKTKQDISKKLIIPAAFIPDGVEVGPP